MTDREKQIAEMAKVACYVCEFGNGFNGDCDLGKDEPCAIALEAAKKLYEIGYRKQVEEMARVICDGCPVCNHIMCHEWYTAQKIYNAGYRKQVDSEWISVDDRLPDKNTMVLGFIHNVYADGSCWDNILVMELNIAGYFVPFNCSEIKDNRVTHWMPLPGVPKMKGGDA